jgi:arabinogalactan endo-1,4-beta-galactosidase
MRTHKTLGYCVGMLLCSLLLESCQLKSQPFILGADISWVQSQEDKGIKFSDEGIHKDVLEILKDHKFNWIRLRLFVDPVADGGYSKEGYCDLEHTLAMAKRIKDAGMKFLLDFHYSDNWADPGKQYKPAKWENLEGEELEAAIRHYSEEVIKAFVAQGTTPDMVQVGNEINHGMMWSSGRIDQSYAVFCSLLRAAETGILAADPNIKIMLHIACGGQNEESIAFFDQMIAHDVAFDIIGQSYYPEWHGTLNDLKNNLTDLISRYHKPVIVVEYKEYKKEVNDIVLSLPDNMGLGTFIWEATSPGWGNLFDMDGKATENIDMYPEIYQKRQSK